MPAINLKLINRVWQPLQHVRVMGCAQTTCDHNKIRRKVQHKVVAIDLFFLYCDIILITVHAIWRYSQQVAFWGLQRLS